MRIIAVANQKGGVGKTTTVVNLADALVRRGRGVLLVDLDPQAHLTTYLGVDPRNLERSVYELLLNNQSLADSVIPVRESIHLCPASMDLAGAEQELVSVVGRETVLRDAIDAYPAPCDYLLIDCPPSLGLLTLNALGAAREVFITLQPHFLSLQGLSQLLETVTVVHKRINPALRISGLLFCMYDARTSLSAEITQDIEQFFEQQRGSETPWRHATIFRTRIRRNIKLAESPSHGKTITEYEPNCHGAEDYSSLAEEVEAMTGSAATAAGDSSQSVSPTVDSSRSPESPATMTTPTTPAGKPVAEATSPSTPAEPDNHPSQQSPLPPSVDSVAHNENHNPPPASNGPATDTPADHNPIDHNSTDHHPH